MLVEIGEAKNEPLKPNLMTGFSPSKKNEERDRTWLSGMTYITSGSFHTNVQTNKLIWNILFSHFSPFDCHLFIYLFFFFFNARISFYDGIFFNISLLVFYPVYSPSKKISRLRVGFYSEKFFGRVNVFRRENAAIFLPEWENIIILIICGRVV